MKSTNFDTVMDTVAQGVLWAFLIVSSPFLAFFWLIGYVKVRYFR